MTLDLSSDLYQIAQDSTFNGSKSESGKINPTHKNVKVKSDGEYFYSFSIKKGVAPRTLIAAVAGTNPTTTPEKSIPDPDKSVKMPFSFLIPKIRHGRKHL